MKILTKIIATIIALPFCVLGGIIFGLGCLLYYPLDLFASCFWDIWEK